MRSEARDQVGPPAQRPSNVDRKTADRQASLTVEKVLIAFAMLVSAVLVLAFGADLLVGWPFHGHSLMMDVAYFSCGLVLAYLSWHTYQQQR
jgi:hypothetical protein